MIFLCISLIHKGTFVGIVGLELLELLDILNCWTSQSLTSQMVRHLNLNISKCWTSQIRHVLMNWWIDVAWIVGHLEFWHLEWLDITKLNKALKDWCSLFGKVSCVGILYCVWLIAGTEYFVSMRCYWRRKKFRWWFE